MLQNRNIYNGTKNEKKKLLVLLTSACLKGFDGGTLMTRNLYVWHLALSCFVSLHPGV